MNCLIVDDEPLARNLLQDYVSKISYLNLVDSCSSPLLAIEVLRNHPVDLMFLDVQMPEITGLSLLKILRKKPLVILTTAYSEYALDGYELDVVDYLLKPITFERFFKAVEKARQRVDLMRPVSLQNVRQGEEIEQSFVFIKDGTKLVKVKLCDIMYVEGLKDYVTIYTRNQKIVTLQRLKSLERQLPANQFLRIHNSYIVAFEAIDSIQKDQVQIGRAFLPVSDTYKKAMKDFISKNYINPPDLG